MQGLIHIILMAVEQGIISLISLRGKSKVWKTTSLKLQSSQLWQIQAHGSLIEKMIQHTAAFSEPERVHL